jgi:nucleotide-binding universal stress UspA family protein
MKVILATEGSEFSEAAVRGFCKMFRTVPNVKLKVVSVVQPSQVATEPFSAPPEYVEQINKISRIRAAEAVERAADGARAAVPSLETVETEVIAGTPEQELVKKAEEWEADLIVTGSHGHGFWKRTWLGSVSDALIHHAPCSVLVIKDEGLAS